MSRGNVLSSKGTPKAGEAATKPHSITSDTIRAELQRILASGIFATADRMKRFLRFVVDETLAGKGDDLNESSLGIEVYDRDETFDPRVDSIVRVDAGRLRSKLREFYESEGASSLIRIEIPKGSYKPLFKWAKETDFGTSAKRRTRTGPAGRTIAVLPFADLSPQRDQEYFADGIAEELMFALSRVPKLRVVSQTSVFAFKGKGMDVKDIGRQLDVKSIMEGSVRKAGQKLRITTRLSDVATGFQIWSEVFNCDLRDVFSVQETIARSVAEALRVSGWGKKPIEFPKPLGCDVKAYNHYLIGRAFWNKQTEPGFRTAVTHFENCLAEDASYAKAYLGMADCYRKLEFWGLMSPSDALPQAKAAA